MPSAITSVRIRRFDRENVRTKAQLENDLIARQRALWRDELMNELYEHAKDELCKSNDSSGIDPATYAAIYIAGYDLCSNYPHDFTSETGGHIRAAALSSVEYDMQQRAARVRNYTREIAALRDSINRWDQLNADVYIDVSVEAIRAALVGLKQHIVPRSITLTQNARSGDHVLNWTYSGLKMTPLYNQTAWFNFHHRVTLDLPRMKFSLPLKKAATASAAPIKGEQTYALFISTAVHPHQMRDRVFCLGDYASAIDAARMSHDWPTVVMLYKQFLETCNPEDAAGQRWPVMPWTRINQMLRPRLRESVASGYNRLRYIQHYAPGAYYQLPVFVGNIQPPSNDGPYAEARSCTIPYLAFMRDDRFLLVQSDSTSKPVPVTFEENFKAFRDVYPDMMTDMLPTQEEHEFICDIINRGAPPLRDNKPLDWSQLGVRSPAPEVDVAPVASIEPAPERPAIREIGYVSSLDEAYAA